MSTGDNPEDFVKSKIDNSDVSLLKIAICEMEWFLSLTHVLLFFQVMVFARSYGPHNQQAKDILDNLKKSSKAKIEYIDVDLLPGFDASLIMTELQRISGQWSFPNIFIGKVSFWRDLSVFLDQNDTWWATDLQIPIIVLFVTLETRWWKFWIGRAERDREIEPHGQDGWWGTLMIEQRIAIGPQM